MQKKSIVERNFWSVTWPIIIDVSLGMSLIFTDIFFLSQISTPVASAIGAIAPVLAVIETIYVAFGMACATTLGQLLGAKKMDRLGSAYGICLSLAVVIGITVATGITCAHGFIGKLLNLSPDAALQTSQYLQIFGISYFFIVIQKTSSSMMRSHGHTRWVMLGALTINTVNITLNTLFLKKIIDFGLTGAQGVALSTVVATSVGMVWLLIGMFTQLPAKISTFSFNADTRQIIKSIVRIAFPSSLEPMNYQLNQVAIMTLIVPMGLVALAARTYVQVSLSFVIIFELAVAIGTQIFIAHHMGARQFELANERLYRSAKQALLITLCLNLILFLGGSFVISLFTKDPDIIKLSVSLFFVSLFWEPAKTLNLIIGFSLRAVGDAKFSSYISVSLWIVGFPLAYLLGVKLGYGLIGIWIALAIDENVRALLHYLRWRKNRWQQNNLAFA